MAIGLVGGIGPLRLLLAARDRTLERDEDRFAGRRARSRPAGGPVAGGDALTAELLAERVGAARLREPAGVAGDLDNVVRTPDGRFPGRRVGDLSALELMVGPAGVVGRLSGSPRTEREGTTPERNTRVPVPLPESVARILNRYEPAERTPGGPLFQPLVPIEFATDSPVRGSADRARPSRGGTPTTDAGSGSRPLSRSMRRTGLMEPTGAVDPLEALRRRAERLVSGVGLPPDPFEEALFRQLEADLDQRRVAADRAILRAFEDAVNRIGGIAPAEAAAADAGFADLVPAAQVSDVGPVATGDLAGLAAGMAAGGGEGAAAAALASGLAGMSADELGFLRDLVAAEGAAQRAQAQREVLGALADLGAQRLAAMADRRAEDRRTGLGLLADLARLNEERQLAAAQMLGDLPVVANPDQRLVELLGSDEPVQVPTGVLGTRVPVIPRQVLLDLQDAAEVAGNDTAAWAEWLAERPEVVGLLREMGLPSNASAVKRLVLGGS